jgi:hypothetical protein
VNRAYYGWLAGSTLSAFGDTALFFALGWAATDIGPQVAVPARPTTHPRALVRLRGDFGKLPVTWRG